ncbi:unnamed protein product [Prunus armeniaca]
MYARNVSSVLCNCFLDCLIALLIVARQQRYFMRKLKKVKKSNGQVLSINEWFLLNSPPGEIQFVANGRKIERKRTGEINTGTPSLMSMVVFRCFG